MIKMNIITVSAIRFLIFIRVYFLNRGFNAAAKYLPAAMIYFIAAAIFFTACGHAAAQNISRKQRQKNLQNEITLCASVGIDNTFFPAHVNSIDITINNGTGNNFEGEILIEAAGSYYRIINVFAGPLSSKKYSVNAKFDNYSGYVHVSIINANNIIIYDERITVKPEQPGDYYILNISGSTSYVNALKRLDITEKRRVITNTYSYGYHSQNYEKPSIKVHTIDINEAFSSSACYEPYSLVILNGADISLIDSQKQKALIDYVVAGGALMISYGGFASRITVSEIAPILPVVITGTEVADGADFYKYASTGSLHSIINEKFRGSMIPLSTGELKNNSNSILNYTNGKGRAIPLIAHSRFGHGIVYYTAFDISQIDIEHIDYLKNNISGILKQSEINKEFTISNLAEQFSIYSEKFNQFTSKPPSFFLVFIILTIFALLVGPFFYFFIRKNVTMIKLIIIPAGFSILFFCILNFFNAEFLLNRSLAAILNFQFIDNSAARSNYITSLSLLIPPMSRGSYDVNLSETILITGKRNFYNNNEGEIIINEDTIKLINPQLDYRFSKYCLIKHQPLEGRFTAVYSAKNTDKSRIEKNPYSRTIFSKDKNNNANTSVNNKDESKISPEDKVQFYVEAATQNKKNKKIISLKNNTSLEITGCKIYYCGSIYTLGSFLPGAEAALIPGALDNPQDFYSSRQIFEHLDSISALISSHLPENIKYNKYGNSSYYYDTQQNFFNLAALYAAKNSPASPVMIGYVENGGLMGASVKSSDCDINDSGTIVIIKL